MSGCEHVEAAGRCRPEPRGLVEVPRRDGVRAVEVGDRPRDAEQSLRASTRRGLHVGELDQPLPTRAVETACHSEGAPPETGVEAGTGPLGSDPPRRGDARSDRGGRFRLVRADEGDRREPRHRHPQVDAVAERAGDAAGVALDRGERTAASALGKGPGVAAGARIHRGDELEASGEGDRPTRPHDRHPALLERLAKCLEDVPVEFRELVEEQHAPICPGHLSGGEGRAAPTMPAYDKVWWGARNGGRRRSSVIPSSPIADATIVTDKAAASSSGGSSPGIVRARSVLPTPGGPLRRRPWPPASATSSARRASTCPRTSDRSGTATSTAVTVLTRSAVEPPEMLTCGIGTGTRRGRRTRIAAAASDKAVTPVTRSPSTSRTSATAASATTIRPTPWAARAAAIGRIPGTVRTSPVSDSSPTNPTVAEPGRTCSEPSRIPIAIARSIEAPDFRRSAGARLIVIRRGGNTNPAFRSAPRTRSRASWRAVSARPTIVQPGIPGATSTS